MFRVEGRSLGGQTKHVIGGNMVPGIRAGISYTCGNLYNVVSWDAMSLAVGIPVLVVVLVLMRCSAVYAPLRYVPSPEQPSTGGSASDTSLVHVCQLLVLRGW